MERYQKRVEELRGEYPFLPREIKDFLTRLGNEVLTCPYEDKRQSLLENLVEAYQRAAKEKSTLSYPALMLRLQTLSQQVEEETGVEGEIRR